MHFNQFAHTNASLETKIAELKRIHYLDHSLLTTETPTKLWLGLVKKTFPQAHSVAAKNQKTAMLLADNLVALPAYAAKKNVNERVFYNVGLQLLGFEPDEDFSLSNPFETMKKYNLTYQKKIISREDVLSAWYDLLCTYTASGQTLLDKLASLGYFKPLWGNVSGPVFFNGKAQPVFDTHKLIREVVYVEAAVDTDHDGKRDLLKTEIIRPAETDTGLKVPAIFTASPYNQGTNDTDGKKMMHNMNTPLKHKEPNNTHYAEIEYQAQEAAVPAPREITAKTETAEETFGREFSYTLNDYLLARGFAAVYSAGIGTLDSDGVRTCGSPAETAAAVAVIEWLNGQRTAFTNKIDGSAIAAWWCNKNIAMTGKSYLGTLATAAATTGVEGLKTIISEAAISSWYDYYRDGGLVVAPGGFPGEDADVLAMECFSRKKHPADYLKVKEAFAQQLNKITAGQARESGNYNTFWDERNYLKNVAKIKADIIMVHGLNDWNVKPRNVFNLWQSLKQLPVTRKLILHQGQHIYINNMRSLDFNDMMNLWLSYKLYDIDNQANTVLPDVLVQDNTQPETWNSFTDWIAPTHDVEELYLRPHELVSSKLGPAEGAANFQDQLTTDDFEYYQNHLNAWTEALLTPDHSPLKHNRLLFRTAAVPADRIIQGEPEVTLSVATNKDHGMLSFMLVDYGSTRRLAPTPAVLERKGLACGFEWREDDLVEFSLAQETPWKMISKGHINLQNRHSNWQNDELQPNYFYNISAKMQPTFYHLPQGHHIGLIIYATDMGMTVRGNEDLAYSINLGASRLKLIFA
ncbi:Xaa-Pro dipeptidyl-peptidase [Liquorilactobacillus sucicola DSM 21376 = JCM 15457]|uniref:Xaa-Pro dipeptidyl-peptidase n=1 Tax=Liquorilactobacillus sucicola DSM 21376 = JCM 15457 TaxID=1423806 RepID=A0A023CY36_9LACO|nr:Xaa-Pro dipeptidyl-peptidase [Liquorilactobacillus sucicola]KRN07577.1 x-prolyl-dipeptidyl aminopeptidase [Liquorilactobacillus sucicola DSM 21376 = JCM 15457]GAJ26792.1 Xaa-Pro dipeptidyl-peptidase [Liquorilactobacillus sucicola DSM 21376 = JCM 15457]